ncbi:hypothetical protein ABZZ79_03000 [Streptomyces sp. NPDC006458]|uniref:hypothetical protein n=1 Tax=Streptomyces sp. NPDC006458 TaxID=3154302 RepID=UPI0033B6A9C1
MKSRPADGEPTEQADEPGEGGEPSSRSRVVALFVVGLVVAWRLVAAFPELAYVVVGVFGTLGCQSFTVWREGRHAEPVETAWQLDVGEALRRLVRDDRGVLLTVLRDDLQLPDTKAVKALLKADGIPWKAVRTREGNGPAVHRDAIPAAPSPADTDAHGSGCCCRSSDNANSNNSAGEGSGEGIRVQRTDGGLVIYDLCEGDNHRTTTDH